MLKLVSLLLSTLLVHRATAIWVNEDFWTSVSPSNQLPAGKTVADFARIDNQDIFPALWITRNRYPNEHFESFGFAFIRPDKRVCGWFAGLHAEAVEVCGGFRVLSVPERYRGQAVFEWVHASEGAAGTVGFNGHRIARRIDAQGNVTYGDAFHDEYSFLGVQTTPEGRGELVSERHGSYMQRVSLLKLKVNPKEHLDKFRSLRRPETASVLPPKQDEAVRGGPITMYIPVEVVRNERGELFERKIVDGRVFYYPFDVAAKRALTVQQVVQQHRAHKQHHEKRRRRQTKQV
ncbi:hypothetical protein PFISCL1PPCAC_22397, partial [Pristionchus fissidentatus]